MNAEDENNIFFARDDYGNSNEMNQLSDIRKLHAYNTNWFHYTK